MYLTLCSHAGMSSRFSALPQYHRLIIGHGIVAALVFLLIVPSAIFVARFYYRNPRLALRLHIYLQILTVALITVVLILGWFAVGPERSLSNPHHGIGVALYTLVLVQFFGGALIHRLEKGKSRWKIPLKLMVSENFVCNFRSLYMILTRLSATPMAWKSNCFARYCPDPSRYDPLWLSQVLVHPLRCGRLRSDRLVLHPLLHVPTGCRLRRLLELYFRSDKNRNH